MPSKRLIQVIKIFILIGLAYVIYRTGSQMIEKDFWSYLPMYFFISCWFFIVILLESRFSKHPRKYTMMGLATLSGVILYMGFPTMPVTPLMFIGFIPLLYVEDWIYRWREKISRWEVFKFTFHAFVVWNILSTFWVTNTSFAPSIAAYTLNALFMSLPWIGYHFVRKRLGNRYRYISLIALWISFEWIHMQWEISWPWLTLGNSFAMYPFTIQWYEYTGHLGGSLWILLMNILIYELIQKIRSKKELKVTDLIYPVFLLFGPLMISVIMYVSYIPNGEFRNISIIQPNYEPHFEKFTVPETEQLRTFVRLSQESLTDSTDYLLFPETVFGPYNIDELNERFTLNTVRSVLDSFPNTNFITGLSSYKLYTQKPKDNQGIHELERNGQKVWLQSQNSAVQFPSGDKDNYEVHIKSKLVPGAEIFPYSKYLFFFEPLVRLAGGTVAGNDRQKERTVFKNQYDEYVAPVVCYESVYGSYVGQYVKKGANAIFIMTNDGWWDDTPGHEQHLHFSRLRAVEHRRSVARSANTGISAFIDQRGSILSETKYDEEAYLQGSIRFNTKSTFYSRWGDLIAKISLLLGILFVIAGIAKRFKK